MSAKPLTKWMKLVCKRAQFQREQYRQPPWTSHQMSHVNKKETNVHRVKQKSNKINKIQKVNQQMSFPNEKLVYDNGIDDLIDLASELSVDACSHSLISTPTRHFAICTVATDRYLATANKKIKLHQDNLKLMGDKFELNDCVDIEIHSVDETNTDPKYLPCIIVEKYERNNILLFKLIWSIQDACSNDLKLVNIDNLTPITIIEVSKLYSRGSTTGHTCNC
ncbi:unnamed protein product [Adineta steineri]|uniref:Uncharacterized protein n=1 Tax=Adineta steineri TaxID=433720 RepID=A0A815R9N2_9BILA|nr:unnamed protein product [Adineta steineri]CAF4151278.1 unnamed protein product [Adineta steineri]